MKEYEIAAKYLNGCSGAAHPQTWFEEAKLASPGDYIRMKHGRDHEKFQREVLPSGREVYTFCNGAVTYIYEFTEL